MMGMGYPTRRDATKESQSSECSPPFLSLLRLHYTIYHQSVYTLCIPSAQPFVREIIANYIQGMASTAMEDLGPPPPDAGSSFDVGTFKTYLASLLLPGGSESLRSCFRLYRAVS